MKICFIIQSLGTGGAERTVSYLANYGVNNGYEVDVVIYDEQFYDLDEKVKIYKLNSAKPTKNPFIRMRNILSRKKQFRKYCQENKPDVIFCMLMGPIIYTLNLKNKPKIIASERSNPKWIKSKHKKIIRSILLNHVDGMVLQTNKAKNFYKKLKCDKVVIPNAIGNLEALTTSANVGKENKICAVGRLCAEKDYPTMLKAMCIVIQKYPNLQLEIYGTGVLENELLALIKELGLEQNVTLMGRHKDVIKKISTAHCFVMTSISEGMPNALMEAMAIGLPCISTDYGNGVEDLITNNVDGIVVSQGNEQQVADAIIKYIEDKDFALKCGQEAQKIKITNSLDNIAKQYFDFCESVLTKNKRHYEKSSNCNNSTW